MRRTIQIVLAMVMLTAVIGVFRAAACGGPAIETMSLPEAAEQAASENEELAGAAMQRLRQAGPAGLEALIDAHRAAIDKHRENPTASNADPRWQRIQAALDAVGGQRDCHASRLFWHTDIDAAKAAAKQSGKPILSLRLLGKLTDEFSCANSRFFRSTLYANEEVGQMLREKFVLHWQSVRPVPKVTIDFGDGRKLERTLTGNSVHYILDSEGRTIDALPGLYGPKAFLRGLETAANCVASVKTLDEANRAEFIRAYHEGRERQVRLQWQNDLEKLGAMPAGRDLQTQLATGLGNQRHIAVAATAISEQKGRVEIPLLAGTLADANVLTEKSDDAVWGRIAELHQDDARLDDASLALIRAKNPTAGRAAQITASKVAVEDPMLRLVRSLQNTIGIDTFRNEYTFHRQIHEWFATGQIAVDVDLNHLNERVYAELFLTPSSDPWLGLVPGDVYTALDNNGVVA